MMMTVVQPTSAGRVRRPQFSAIYNKKKDYPPFSLPLAWQLARGGEKEVGRGGGGSLIIVINIIMITIMITIIISVQRAIPSASLHCIYPTSEPKDRDRKRRAAC